MLTLQTLPKRKHFDLTKKRRTKRLSSAQDTIKSLEKQMKIAALQGKIQ